MQPEMRWKRRGLHRLFFFFVLLPMMCVFPYLRGINNPNEFVRVFTVVALVENHTWAYDEQLKMWGWLNDTAKVRGKDGLDHHFQVKGPGAVYLGLPGYVVFSKVVAPLLGKHYPALTASQDEKLWWLRMATWAMRLCGSQLPCFLFLLWFEKYLRDFSPDAVLRYGAVAACGLGTNYLAYVHMFASHSQYAVFAFLGFALAERELRRSHGDTARMDPWMAAASGFCISATVTLEYHALFLAIVLTLFAMGVFRKPSRFLAFAAGGLSNVPHMMYFQWVCYGNPFTPGHKLIDNAKFAAEHEQGLFGILWPSWSHIQALAVDPGFGFFGMSPYMWLALVGAPLLLFMPRGGPAARSHTRLVTVVWLVAMAVCFGVNAGFIEWRAGWTVGPRYLVVCAPFFAFGALWALERFAHGSRARRAIARGVGGGLALASIVAIGTVGLVYDTLPENIGRPFAQFAWPMMRTGFVPHHVGEWFGWSTTTLWYVCCAAMLLAPTVVTLIDQPGDRAKEIALRLGSFALALGVGLAPAFTTPPDHTPLFVVHPSSVFIPIWEPPGRDRITRLREDAERYGTRGPGPCLWYKVADLNRVVGMDAAAAQASARARGVPRDRCPPTRF